MHGHSFNDDVNGPGSYQQMSFHERMVQAGGGARARSRSRSPNKGSGWGDNPSRTRSRSRSRSADRIDTAPPPRERSPVRSFHKYMMEKAQSPQRQQVLPHSSDTARGFTSSVDQHTRSGERLQSPSDDAPRERRGSPSAGQNNEGYANVEPLSSHVGEEEEEGMIRADDEEGMIARNDDSMFQATDEDPHPSSL